MLNLESAFRKLIRESYLTYRGYRGERFIDKNGERIYYQNKSYTVQEFKDHIDNYIKEQAAGIQNSIKKP